MVQYVAEMLLKINERGRWIDPPPEDPKLRAQQDEEIFQTARLVKYGFFMRAFFLTHCARSCGHFMSLIMGDYVAGFLGPSPISGSYFIPNTPYRSQRGQR